MSKLAQRLQRVSEGTPQPLGFAPAARLERALPLALIVSTTRSTEKITAAAIKNGAEFILVPFDPKSRAKPKTPAGAGETPWGVKVSELSDSQHAQLKAAGCDFVVIGPEGTAVRLMSDEDVAAVVAVGTDTEDRLLRAIDGLPGEAIMIDAEPEDTLTVRAMMEYSIVATGLGQNLLVPASEKWGREEFEQLRDAGFAGVVVNVETAADAAALADARKAIQQIPNRRRRDDKPRARVPQLSVGIDVQSDPPDNPDFDPDDDDDDDY